MNLKNLLKEQTFEAKMMLWHVIINEVKLNVSPGSSFNCSEPSWFKFALQRWMISCKIEIDQSTSYCVQKDTKNIIETHTIETMHMKVVIIFGPMVSEMYKKAIVNE